ncbi:hypothetical protein ABZ621_01280 [Streptomyces sp. NPDC007863]|uniref:hypothetical protein n=1 Tax=Streptomyces sp. NPDC007863 TaxID=3154894 RepID=UPI0033F53498
MRPAGPSVLPALRASMAELATPARVYVAAGRFAGPDPDLPELAAEVRAVLAAMASDEAWARFLPGYVPPPVPEICAALEPLETYEAAPFLARLATVDLYWPTHRHLPADVAGRAADRVVALLGPDASWWTNHDEAGGAVTGVSPFFDSLLAGTDGEHFAVALQVADD